MKHERRGEYDEVFDKTQVIERFTDSCGIFLLMFKAVWPTTAREILNCT